MADDQPDPVKPNDPIIGLARLVKRMRDAQTRYFRGRTSQALQESKDLERHVDQAIAAILNPEQPKLWDKL